MAEGLTVKQIADIVGKDKPKTYRAIKKLNIEPLANDKNRIIYPEEAAEMIADYFHKEEEKPKQEPADGEKQIMLDYIEQLKQELQAKNELIEKQADQITELTQAIKSTADSIKAAQAVNITDKQLLLENQPKRRSWWPFGKKQANE